MISVSDSLISSEADRPGALARWRIPWPRPWSAIGQVRRGQCRGPASACSARRRWASHASVRVRARSSSSSRSSSRSRVASVRSRSSSAAALAPAAQAHGLRLAGPGRFRRPQPQRGPRRRRPAARPARPPASVLLLRLPRRPLRPRRPGRRRRVRSRRRRCAAGPRGGSLDLAGVGGGGLGEPVVGLTGPFLLSGQPRAHVLGRLVGVGAHLVGDGGAASASARAASAAAARCSAAARAASTSASAAVGSAMVATAPVSRSAVAARVPRGRASGGGVRRRSCRPWRRLVGVGVGDGHAVLGGASRLRSR